MSLIFVEIPDLLRNAEIGNRKRFFGVRRLRDVTLSYGLHEIALLRKRTTNTSKQHGISRGSAQDESCCRFSWEESAMCQCPRSNAATNFRNNLNGDLLFKSFCKHVLHGSCDSCLVALSIQGFPSIRWQEQM